MAVLAMLGINLYLMFKSRRNVQGDAGHYMLMHQRLDSLSQLVNDQLKHGRETTDRATLSVQQKMDSLVQVLTAQLNESRE